MVSGLYLCSPKMECLFCKDNGEEPLHDNKNCKCNYQRHDSCWINYVHSQRNLTCPTCRKVLSSVPKTISALHRPIYNIYPTAPSIEPYSSQNTEITFEEFREILGLPATHQTTPLIHSNTQSHNHHVPFSQRNWPGKIKFICGLISIVAIVIITIVVIVTVL